VNALAVAGLDVAFGPRAVLRGLDLTVARGELLGLVGPNGAGKSTLLRAFVGLVPRRAGAVDVLGLDPARQSLAIRRRCCYLPGETGVYQQMTGAAFLAFAHGFYPALQRALQERLLAQFQLPLRQRVRTYSAGMKQKLALVATLVPDVDLYLLDEPDRALDASVRFFLRDVLLDLRGAGKTIVLSSHHLSEIESLADRMEFLAGGALVAPDRIAAARARLRRRVRLHLAPGTALPPGGREFAREPDGTLVVETDADPLGWLAALPAERVRSAEVGTVRLEELYQLLLPGQPAGGAP